MNHSSPRHPPAVHRRPSIAIGAVACDPASPGGLNRYTTELLPDLLDEGCDLAYVASSALRHRDGRVRLVPHPWLTRGDFTGNSLRFLWYQTLLRADLKHRGVDLFYSPVPDGMIRPPCRQVITIHDVLPLRYPESNPRLQYYYRYVLPRIITASSAVITVSRATKDDLVNWYGLDGDHIHVVYQGYRRDVFQPVPRDEVERVLARHGLGEYVLTVGETRPYKNIPRLLEAFAGVQRAGVQLVIVGRLNKRGVDLTAMARSLGIQDRVRFMDGVPDDVLAALYSGARVFAFPSLYEGFGIPPLEAMACGCPVLVSRSSSLPEVCGEAALYVDPLEVSSIREGLDRLLADAVLSSDLASRGLERAKTFSYNVAASNIYRILESYASGKKIDNSMDPGEPATTKYQDPANR